MCWGNNSSSAIGDNTTTARLVPTQVTGLTSGVTAIAVGAGYTYAVAAGGGVVCWGTNDPNDLDDEEGETGGLIPAGVAGSR